MDRGIRATARQVVSPVAHAFGMYLFWALGGGIGFILPPVIAVAWTILFVSGFLAFYLGWSKTHRRRLWADLRPRGLGRGFRWILAAVLVQPVFSLSIELLLGLDSAGMPPPPDLHYRFASRPLGWLVIPLIAALVAPVVEEFSFRGRLQRRLERHFSPVTAITVAAAVFAVMHGSATWLPSYFTSGLILGYATWRTGSIWAGTTIHFTNNLAATVLPFPIGYLRLVAGAHFTVACLATALVFGTLLVHFLNRAGAAVHADARRRGPRSAACGGELRVRRAGVGLP